MSSDSRDELVSLRCGFVKTHFDNAWAQPCPCDVKNQSNQFLHFKRFMCHLDYFFYFGFELLASPLFPCIGGKFLD